MSPIRIEAGPMFSGKSTTLYAHIEGYLIAEREIGRDILVFNHASDNRYGENQLSSHSGLNVAAIAVRDSWELLAYFCQVNETTYQLKPEFADLMAVFIDEAQFFDADMPQVVTFIDTELGIDVYLAGLDTDFRGKTFGPMGDLMAVADHVQKHTAICKKRVDGKICGQPATKTQRLVNDKPANFSEPIILVGAQEAYTARCKEHHEIPGKPPLAAKSGD